jgi:hypothetical protein
LPKECGHEVENLQLASKNDFRRIVVIKRKTFNKMVEILTEAQKKRNLAVDGVIN